MKTYLFGFLETGYAFFVIDLVGTAVMYQDFLNWDSLYHTGFGGRGMGVDNRPEHVQPEGGVRGGLRRGCCGPHPAPGILYPFASVHTHLPGQSRDFIK